MFRDTKLFWRTNTTVEVRLYYQKELDAISIQIFNQTEDREMPILYVRKSEVGLNLHKDTIEEAVKTGESAQKALFWRIDVKRRHVYS